MAHGRGVNFARNLRSSLAALVANTVVGLAFSILLARGLSEPERGVYAVALTLALFVEFGAQLGQRLSVIYRIGRGGGERSVAVGAALVLSLAALAVVIALSLAFADVLQRRVLAGAGRDILLVALAIGVVEVISGLFEGVARAVDRFALRNRATVASTMLSFVAVALAVGPLGGWALAALWAVCAARAFVGSWLVAASLRETGVRLRGIGAELGPALRFGFPSYLQTLMGKIHERVDVVLLAALGVDAAQIAAYAIAVNVVDRLRVVPDSVGSALLPQLASLPHDETPAFTARIVRMTLFWVGAMALGLALAAPPLLPALFGSGYSASVVPFWILLPATVSLTFRRVLSNYFTASGEPGFNAAVQVVAVIVNIGVNLWAIPRFGIAGAALASLTSYGLEGVLTGIGFWRRSGLRPSEILVPPLAEIADQLRRARRQVLGERSPG